MCKKLGLTWTIKIAVIIGLCGTISRYFIATSFLFVYFGQFLLGCCACFIVNTVMEFCYNWFDEKERPIYLSITSIMNIFGGGIGTLIPILFVSTKEDESKIDL